MKLTILLAAMVLVASVAGAGTRVLSVEAKQDANASKHIKSAEQLADERDLTNNVYQLAIEFGYGPKYPPYVPAVETVLAKKAKQIKRTVRPKVKLGTATDEEMWLWMLITDTMQLILDCKARYAGFRFTQNANLGKP